MSESTIINGFAKCGLYPFNADAIDYGQLIKKGKLNDNSVENNDQLVPKEILNHFLTQFESNLDPNQLNEFKKSKHEWQEDICDVSLFKFWRKVGGSINSGDDSIQLSGANDIIFEYIDATNEEFNLNGEIINLDFDTTEVIVSHDEHTNNARICDEVTCDEITCDKLPCDKLHCDELPCDILPCDELPCDELPCDKGTHDERTDDDDERSYDERSDDEQTEDERTDDEGSYTEQSAEQNNKDASTPTALTSFPTVHQEPSTCFRGLLFWPGRNPTSGKPGMKRKKEKVKIPAVLTSEDAINYLKAKEAEKERLEAEKMERKKQRELKKEEKQKNEEEKNKLKEERKKQMKIKAELQKAMKKKREAEIAEKKQRIAAKKAGKDAAKKVRDNAKRRKQEQEEKFMAAFQKHLVS